MRITTIIIWYILRAEIYKTRAAANYSLKPKTMEKVKALIASILPPALAFLVAGLSADQFIENMMTFAGIVSLVPILAEAIKVTWNLAGATWFWKIKVMKLVTWSLSLILVFLSWFVGWAFEEFSYLMLVGYGIGAGLVTNEYFSLTTIKLLLAAIFNNK